MVRGPPSGLRGVFYLMYTEYLPRVRPFGWMLPLDPDNKCPFPLSYLPELQAVDWVCDEYTLFSGGGLVSYIISDSDALLRSWLDK